MSAPALSARDCCAPCDSIPITQVAGPAGTNGSDGAAGSAGANAFTLTTGGFTQPIVGGTVSVAVASSAFAVIGQVVYVQNAGYYTVDAIADSTHLTLNNLGYSGNAAPGAVIGAGQKVGPGGKKGADGVAVGVTLNSISPTTTRGDLIVDNGANAPAASDVRFPAGTDGQQLTALAAQPTGLIYRTITPNAATDNVVPRFDASGATTPTPLQSSGIQITDTTAIQTTDGNARGTSAVDLQPVRGVATQVASGNNSNIAGGKNNTASGTGSTVGGGDTNIASGLDSCVAGGTTNTASAQFSFVGAGSTNVASGASSAVLSGNNNTASGQGAVAFGEANSATNTDDAVLGGASNTALGGASVTIGGFQGSAYLFGQVAHSSGKFTTVGDAQASEIIFKGATTDATPTEIFIGPASQRATIPSGITWAFSILGVARRDTGISVVFKVEGGIKNIAGVVTLVAAITTTVVSDGSGGALVAGSFVASADDPNNALIITVTGVAGQNWHWVGHVRLVEVGY